MLKSTKFKRILRKCIFKNTQKFQKKRRFICTARSRMTTEQELASTTNDIAVTRWQKKTHDSNNKISHEKWKKPGWQKNGEKRHVITTNGNMLATFPTKIANNSSIVDGSLLPSHLILVFHNWFGIRPRILFAYEYIIYSFYLVLSHHGTIQVFVNITRSFTNSCVISKKHVQ